MSKKRGLSKETKELYTSLGRSVFLCFVALFAIVIATVAWFANNTSVNGSGASITANDDVLFVLACKGNRIPAEQEYLLNQIESESLVWGNTRLSLGKTLHYSKYIDSKNGTVVEEQNDYYSTSGEFSWCFDKTVTFYPGARGELVFYVIPKVDGLSSISLNIEILAYKKVSDSFKTGAVLNADEKLAKLLKGHLLLFYSFDDNLGYSDWMGEKRTVTIRSDDDSSLVKDVPYKVTLYWVWPKQYRNLIYDKFSTRGDLFSSTMNNSDYVKLIKYINMNKDYFFYNEVNDYPVTSDSMNEENFKKGNIYYNHADEYIGMNADFIYLSVSTE